MDFHQRLVQTFPDAIPAGEFVRRGRARLVPHGFSPGNALPMIGICRDELATRFFGLVQEVWGPAFNLAGLAGMLSLGTTGMTAARLHAPDVDRRRRFVIYAMPHIGIDQHGEVGRCRRPGMLEDSIACGALIAFQNELRAGRAVADLDVDDLEQSNLRRRLSGLIHAGQVPDLVTITTLTLGVIQHDLRRLLPYLVGDLPTDVAVLTGIKIHGPAESDYIEPDESYVWYDDGRVETVVMER